MSVKVTSLVWEHSRASGTARLVLLAIADFSDDAGSAWPSLTTIARKCNVSRSTAIRAVAELVGGGELVRVHGGGRHGRGGVSNGYRVTVKESQPDTTSPARSGVTDGTSSEMELVPNRAEVVSPVEPEPSLEPSVKKSRRSAPAGLERFGEFWNAYPLKKAHKAARAKWAIALREATADEIIDGAKRYASEQRRPLRPGEFRPGTAHPTTWLNQGRWSDEYPTPDEPSTGPNETYR